MIDKQAFNDTVEQSRYQGVFDQLNLDNRLSEDLSDGKRDFPFLVRMYASHFKWHIALAVVFNILLAFYWSDIVYAKSYAVVGNILLFCFIQDRLSRFSMSARGVNYERGRKALKHGFKAWDRPGTGHVLKRGR